MKKEINNFKDFIQTHKTAIIGLFIISLLTYGIKMFHYSISIDTEVLICQPSSLLQSWIGIDRPVLVFLKYILGLNPFNPLLSTSITYFLFTGFSIVLYYLFYRIRKKDSNINLFLFGSVILTSAIFIEQLNFMLQSAEIVILLNIMCLGILIFQIAYEQRKPFFYILSILCVTFSFGGYQAFVPMFITIITLITYLHILNNSFHWKDIIKFCLTAAFIFITSLIGYFIGSYLSRSLFNVASSSYLTSKILWFDEPLLYTIKRVFTTILDGYFGAFNQKLLFYGYINVIAFALVIITMLKELIKGKEKVLAFLFSIIILIVPFALAIVLGDKELYRAQLSLPIVIAFIISFLLSKNKYFYRTQITIIIVCIFSQFIMTNRLLTSDYIRYQEDVAYATQLYNALSKYDIQNKEVIMLGRYVAHNASITTRGEVMGVSFFEWDQYEPRGVGIRASYFMKTLGYDITANESIEEYERAKEKLNDLDVFPKETSILEEDNFIIVRLA